MTKEDLVKHCLDNIKSIKSEMDTINKSREKALKFYNGDENIVKVIEGRSKATTTDVMDAIEWVKPSLLEMFTSGNEIVKFDPVTKEDVEPTEKLSILTNHQVKVKNPWFIIMHDWLDDCLKLKTGAVKRQWVKKIETFTKEFEGMTETELQSFIVANPNVEIVNQKPRVVQPSQSDAMGNIIQPEVLVFDGEFKFTIEDEYPEIKAIPAENIGFPQRARDIEDCEFFYERYRLSNAEFKRKYGEKLANELSAEDDSDAVEDERYRDLGGRDFKYDDSKKEFICYECYYKDEKSGLPFIVDICGKEIVVESRKNKYNMPPYRLITPVKMAHRMMGLSMADLVKEIMLIRTALLRQMLDNIYFSNNRRYFGDPNRVNLDDFYNNNKPMAFIRTVGDPRGACMPEEKAPIPPELFQFWETLNTEKDYHSGVPRSFQGVTKAQLSKTWRGASQQIQQAAQRVGMMARLIAEMGVAPLMSDIAKMNIQFLKKETAVRYLGTFLDIKPDNIIGKFDIVVNVGTGTGDKAETIGFIQQLLGLYAQVFKTGIPIVTPQNVYNAFKELIKAMNYKNVDDFITEPQMLQSLMGLLKTLMISGTAQTNPQIMQSMMAVANAFGLMPQIQAALNAGTHEAQATPEQPKTASQPFQPATEKIGGEFFG